MYLNWLEHFVISFMKIKNRRGLKIKIDPCGTPYWITLGFEPTLFIDTYCSLFVRYEWNQSKVIPWTPHVFNFDSRISWLTQSNALQKSRNKENTILPESKVLQEMQNGLSSRLYSTKSILLFMQDRVIFQVIIQLSICNFFKYLAKNW